MSLGSLNIDLNANIAKFESALDRASYLAKSAMDKIAGSAATAETAMKGLEGALGKVGMAMSTLGVVGSITGLIEIAKSSIAGAAELKHMSMQTGVSVEALSALKGVAKLTGMDLATAGQGAAKLGKAMYDAQGGSQKQQQAFKNLGIAYTDASGKLRPVGDVMLDVGKKLLNSADGAGKAGIAIDLMGKKGATMIPVLEQLALRGNVNGKITTELAEKAEQLEIAWAKMVATMNSWKFGALSAIMPSLERIIPLVPKIATGLVGLFTVTKVLPMAISAVTAAITTLGSVTSASGLIGIGIFSKLRTSVIALNAAMLANPLVAIAAATLAAAAALYVFQDKLLTLGGVTASVGNWIGGVWDVIRDGTSGLWTSVKDVFGKISAWITQVFGGVKDTVGGFFSWALDIAKSYINVSIGAWVGLGKAAIIVFESMRTAWKNALDWMSGLGRDFGAGVAAALHGDIAFTAFRNRMNAAGSAVSQVGAQIKDALSEATNTDYVGKMAGAASNVFERIKQNALRRKAEDDAARKGAPDIKNTIQNVDTSSATTDPFKQAMQDLQRQTVGMQYVVDNWDKFAGKIRDSKAAMAEFDVTLGKFSDTQRAAAKLPPLTATQKQAYIDASKALQDLEIREKQLIALKKFDDSVVKINEETAGLKESAIQREINGQMAQLEAAGIKKGTDEYIRRQQVMSQAIQGKHQVEFDTGMTEYFAQQKIGIDNEQFMISLLGQDSLSVAKLTEAHRIDAEVQDKLRQARRDGLNLSDEEIAKQLQQADAIKQTRMAQIDLAAAIQKTPEYGFHQAMVKYQEAANDMGTQVENTMTNALKGVEDAFVQLSVTGKLSFKSLVDSVVADVARMGWKSMISSALGWVQNGGLGQGLANLASGAGATGAAKGASDALSSTAANTALTTLGTSATSGTAAISTLTASITAQDAVMATATASLSTLTAAAGTAASALASMSVSSAAGGLGGLAGALGGGETMLPAGLDGGSVPWYSALAGRFADGGDPPVGRPSLVGEQGPEIFVPKTAGTILPNDVFKQASHGSDQPQQSNVININNHFAAGTDTRTIDQAAMQMGAHVQRALRRNG
jgi:lambda family phage tail tape measure protein